jgi:hypothetical protein
MVPSLKKWALASKKRAPRPAAVMFWRHVQKAQGGPLGIFLDKIGFWTLTEDEEWLFNSLQLFHKRGSVISIHEDDRKCFLKIFLVEFWGPRGTVWRSVGACAVPL